MSKRYKLEYKSTMMHPMLIDTVGRRVIIVKVPTIEDRSLVNICNTLNEHEALKQRVKELVEALELVMKTVADCHDCWRLDAPKEEQERVQGLINKAKEQKEV